MFYVYELRDGETGETFYVGKGSGRRMYQHKYKARGGEQTPRADRIRAILAAGGTVVCVVIFETEDEREAYTREEKRIRYRWRKNLTNQTDGGCGVKNVTAAVRARLAAGRRGRKASPETRERQRAAKLGVPISARTRAKIAAYQRGSSHPWASEQAKANLASGRTTFAGRRHTPETIEKMRAAKRGHVVSEETRRKISDAKKGKRS